MTKYPIKSIPTNQEAERKLTITHPRARHFVELVPSVAIVKGAQRSKYDAQKTYNNASTGSVFCRIITIYRRT